MNLREFSDFLPHFKIKLGSSMSLRWTPHPVIVTIRENRDYIRVLLYSYYTTITGRGILDIIFMWSVPCFKSESLQLKKNVKNDISWRPYYQLNTVGSGSQL